MSEVTPFDVVSAETIGLHYVFFTELFRTSLAASQEIMEGHSIRLALFRYAPGLTPPVNPAWTGADTLAELKATNPGWVEVTGNGYPLTHELPVGTRTVAGSRYVIFSDYPFSELDGPVEVNAIAVEYIGALGGVTNPLIMVTATPLNGGMNVMPGDYLTSSPDDTLGADSNRWLFGWSVVTPDPAEGPLMISKGSPDFEVSGSQHAWMYPQRANMIANPSFEKPGVDFWSSNAAVTQVEDGAPGGGAWAGSFDGTSPVVAESNVFPTRLGELDSEQWTVQLMAKGDGILKVGIVYWDVDYRATSVNWGEDEEWVLSTDTWTHVTAQRHCPEAHLAMLRLELEGTGLIIDRVLVERGYLRDWPYFDGDEKYGALDDFSWYGGKADRQGASYSLWYNHRRAVVGRLYARTVDPNDPESNVTDEDMEEQGLVYRWVPAGITVVPHMDVFYPHDVQNPVPPKAAGVLPYYDEAITPDGITNPWL